MNNLLFQDDARRLRVLLPQQQLQAMQHLCVTSHPKETGGILIGSYSDDLNQTSIFRVTAPPPKSKHWRSRFFRGNSGIVETLDQEWLHGNYYLGEWHYHPDSAPSPSSTDISQMLSLSRHKGLKCPEPIMIILGGSTESWGMYACVIRDGIVVTLSLC